MKNKLKLLSLAAALLLPQYLLAASGPGADLVQKCQDNVDKAKKQLSPVVAQECVQKLTGPVLTELQNTDPGKAAAIISHNNALVDLKKLTANYSGKSLAEALAREMEASACALCELGLGPRPELAFSWFETNVGGRAATVKNAVRTWDALGGTRTGSLAAETEKYSKETWNKQKIMARYQRLSAWARKNTDVLTRAPAAAAAKPDFTALADTLRTDLVMDGDDYYVDLLDSLAINAAKAAPASAAAAAKKDKAAAATAAKTAELKGRSASEQKDYLDGAFDNARPGAGVPAVEAGGKGAKFTPVPITTAQAAQLSAKMGTVKDGKFTGYLADEVRGTKAGDELTAFFADKEYAKTGGNALNLKFEKGTGSLSNALGWWSGDKKTTTVNTKLVDDYCAGKKITPEQMLKSDEHLKGVARYVAPNFVHETTHQRQDAWAARNGLDYIKYKGGSTGQPYQMEMETEAFSMQAAFSAEKAKKTGPAYLAQISPSHRANAERFMEDGVDAMRTDKHKLYTGISSMEGASAQEFQKAKGAADYVKILEDKRRADPSSLTAKEQADLKLYREAMDSRFKWYTMVQQKSAADERKLLEWREAFDAPPAAAVPKPGA
ncbi:MAG: hypothetical protein AB7V08_03780 [Elusimicrobiales bacterium]